MINIKSRQNETVIQFKYKINYKNEDYLYKVGYFWGKNKIKLFNLVFK